LGDTPAVRYHPRLRHLQLPPLGVVGPPGGTVTAGGLIFITGGGHVLYALDTRDGSVRWQWDLGRAGWAVPMTYRTRHGRQFVVIATGRGEDSRLMAFTLADQ
jgi:quinoprotein glucose dehydrogenase